MAPQANCCTDLLKKNPENKLNSRLFWLQINSDYVLILSFALSVFHTGKKREAIKSIRAPELYFWHS